MQTLKETFESRSKWPVETANAFHRALSEHGPESMAALTYGSQTGSNVKTLAATFRRYGFFGATVYAGALRGPGRYKHLILVGVIR